MSDGKPDLGSARKDIAVDFLEKAASGKARQAFSEHAGPTFRHHNPWFRGDADSLARGMDDNHAANPEKLLDVEHVLEDGNFVAVHSRVLHRPDDMPVAVFHLFRFDGDRIAELWDVGQALPPASLNEHGMF